MPNTQLTTSPNLTTNEVVADGVTAIAAAAVADAGALTFAAGAIDTGTDMTAAEAAALVVDIAAIHGKLNALMAALRTAGTLTT